MIPEAEEELDKFIVSVGVSFEENSRRTEAYNLLHGQDLGGDLNFT